MDGSRASMRFWQYWCLKRGRCRLSITSLHNLAEEDYQVVIHTVEG
jgi:hypothetical protein